MRVVQPAGSTRVWVFRSENRKVNGRIGAVVDAPTDRSLMAVLGESKEPELAVGMRWSLGPMNRRHDVVERGRPHRVREVGEASQGGVAPTAAIGETPKHHFP